MRIGIIAALPGELKPLVKGWERLPVSSGSGVRMWQRPASAGAEEVVAVCAGMGAVAARKAFVAAEHLGGMDCVLSVGWAGALTHFEKISPVMSEVIDAQTGERFTLTDRKRVLRVVTTARVADRTEKLRLGESYGAVAVDMEAAHVARLAAMRGIPMCCFKVISDGHDAELPDINPFIDENGQMKMTAFLAYVAVRPACWGSLIQLGRRSAAAAQQLAISIGEFLEDPDPIRWNRQGHAKRKDAGESAE